MLYRRVLALAEPAPPQLYPLSLHDALPISAGTYPTTPEASTSSVPEAGGVTTSTSSTAAGEIPSVPPTGVPAVVARSEEHTSELQSRENLVCRLLLEKKKERTRR